MVDRIEVPKDISPKDFFEKFIPEQFEKNKANLPDKLKGLTASMVFALTGENGGAWTIKYDKGSLSAKAGDDPERIVKIVQKVDDWRAGVTGQRGLRLEMPGAGGAGKGLTASGPSLSQDKIDRLKTMDGAIMFRITDAAKGDWAITVKFGKTDKPDPDCTITIASEDAKAMRKGELNPQMAFMSGKINVQGDLGFAMQIGTTFMM